MTLTWHCKKCGEVHPHADAEALALAAHCEYIRCPVCTGEAHLKRTGPAPVAPPDDRPHEAAPLVQTVPRKIKDVQTSAQKWAKIFADAKAEIAATAEWKPQ